VFALVIFTGAKKTFAVDIIPSNVWGVHFGNCMNCWIQPTDCIDGLATNNGWYGFSSVQFAHLTDTLNDVVFYVKADPSYPVDNWDGSFSISLFQAPDGSQVQFPPGLTCSVSLPTTYGMDSQGWTKIKFDLTTLDPACFEPINGATSYGGTIAFYLRGTNPGASLFKYHFCAGPVSDYPENPSYPHDITGQPLFFNYYYPYTMDGPIAFVFNEPSPEPTITISEPTNLDQISNAFNIMGQGYDFGPSGVITANLYNSDGVGIWSKASYIFENEPFTILANGFPTGTYDLKLQLTDSDGFAHAIDPGIQISVIVNIPYEIDGEPENPLVVSVDPEAYYLAHSSYSQATALYSTITNAIGPLIVSVGNWTQSFSQHFAQTDAVANGTSMGNAVALVKVYSTNINSLFNNFPVSQAIVILVVWYLALAVLTAIRFIVKLIK